jgi:hypothetical protein
MQTERLRIDNIIVGYRKKPGEFYYYSKDLYAWSGQPIKFKQTDKYTGLKDKNNKLIFEHDIISCNDNFFEIIYDKKLDKFYLLELSTDTIFNTEDVLKSKNFVFYSYSFIQKA